MEFLLGLIVAVIIQLLVDYLHKVLWQHHNEQVIARIDSLFLSQKDHFEDMRKELAMVHDHLDIVGEDLHLPTATPESDTREHENFE